MSILYAVLVVWLVLSVVIAWLDYRAKRVIWESQEVIKRALRTGLENQIAIMDAHSALMPHINGELHVKHLQERLSETRRSRVMVVKGG